MHYLKCGGQREAGYGRVARRNVFILGLFSTTASAIAWSTSIGDVK